MFCPECGKTLLDNTSVCPTCGATVPAIPVAEGESAAAPPPPHSQLPSYSPPPVQQPPYTPPPVAPPAYGTQPGTAAYGGSPPTAAADILRNVKTYFIVSAITNGLAAILWLLGALLIGISTLGCGCVLLVVPILNIVAIVFDIMSISKLNAAPSPNNYSSLKTATYLDIASILTFNVIGLVMGILNMQNLGRNEVREYFHAQ